jgi:hypothetical protein
LNKTLQIRNIGQTLLEGPRSILPPNAGGDWLEKDISIYTNDFPEVRIEQISLWSDSTMNKESDFLKPLIRFAHWERKNDLQKGREINFPDVRIFLGYIDEEFFNLLNNAIIEIQNCIPNLTFKSLGISLARDVANIERGIQDKDYSVYIRNGIQSMTYYSPFLDNDTFSSKIFELKELMLKSMKQISLDGWKERYDSPFDTNSFDWNYDEINGR